MNRLRHFVAVLMWRVQCSWLWRFRFVRGAAYHGGRHIDWAPCRCEECGWRGPVRWTCHTYEDDGSGEDVCPVDECPKCGSQDLQENYQ